VESLGIPDDGELEAEIAGALPMFPLEAEAEAAIEESAHPPRRAAYPWLQNLGRTMERLLRRARITLHPVKPAVARGGEWAKAELTRGSQHAKEQLARGSERAKELLQRSNETAKGKLGPLVESVRRNPKDPRVLGAGAGILVLVLVLLVLIFRSGSEREVADSTAPGSTLGASSSAAASPHVDKKTSDPKESTLVACTISRQAALIASKVSKDVPLELLAASGGERIWIGFAADATSAEGLSVDTLTFSVSSQLHSRAPGNLRAVVPFATKSYPLFVVAADGKFDKLLDWRTLAVEPPAVVGRAGGSLVIASKPSEPASPLWPLEGDAPVEALRTLEVPGQGHAIVFRRRGEILAGWLDGNRSPKGSLVRVAGAGAPAGSPVGSPTIAHNGQSIAIAFADRPTAIDPWGIRLAQASTMNVPASTTAFTVPPGGPGGPSIAPALAASPDGRWLLVWTEGTGGDHDVRAQTLAPDFAPIGPPFTVSKPGSNAGQGAAVINSGRGLVVYLTLAGQNYELWGTMIDCR
jgi:hypothetical protein